MRGTRRFGWLAAAAVATGLVGGAGPAGAASTFVQASGTLTDFAPSTANATDGASADLWAVAAGGGSTFFVFFTGLDPAAAGPHYNTGGVPSTETEVWLDFTVLPGGYGFAATVVPFEIEPGTARSMVIHYDPTQDGGPMPGAAGGRQACLPVEF